MSALLPIGRFARLAGLSVGALRHYAEIDLLVPARTDPQTGYRYYSPEQLPTARRIASLRELDVPLPVIRELRDAPAARVRDRLRAYRAQLEARVWRLQRQSHRLAYYTEEIPMHETPSATTSQEADAAAGHSHEPGDHDHEHDHEHGDGGHEHGSGPDRRPLTTAALDPDDERRLAARLFNGVWELLERPERSTGEDDTMVHAAHASRYHWGVVGQPVHWARGEWQISRVYAVLGRSEPALHHGRRYLALVEEHQLAPFDRAYAHEAIARGYRVAGDPGPQAEHLALAAPPPRRSPTPRSWSSCSPTWTSSPAEPGRRHGFRSVAPVVQAAEGPVLVRERTISTTCATASSSGTPLRWEPSR